MSTDLREYFKTQRELLHTELPRLRDQIIAHCDPKQIILFGSMARGEENGLSDIDLFVIGLSAVDFKARQRDLRDAIDISVEAEIFYYTPDELDRLLPVSSFARSALRDGRIIYERMEE
ncbi:MAG: nucleotidyltransferase domain-containing protein [Spirochaetaceae bacterium]|nr:nucleotidyltransferase domain-containing protein [Spirochaetaceae bacterium]